MSARLAHIWRHPIKGVGAEALDSVCLATDGPLPGDRAWAVLRAGQSDTGEWQRCATFLRGASAPELMAIEATTTDGRLDLRHPKKPPLSIDPTHDGARLVAWLADLWPGDAPAPDALIAAPAQGMTDAPFPSVSVLNLASLRAVSDAAGQRLDPRRFRGNLWIDGVDAWDEAGWVGRRLAIGGAMLEIVEPIGRCRATEANPETGARDVPVLDLLEAAQGATEFGVYARVITGGEIAVGDSAAVL